MPSILVDLLADCGTRGIRLSLAGGDGLVIDAPQDALTPDLLAQLRACKAKLLEFLPAQEGSDAAAIIEANKGGLSIDLQPEVDAGEWREIFDADGRSTWHRADMATYEIIDPPEPCPICGGLAVWQNLAGGWHCEACRPRTTGPRLREHAQRLRLPVIDS